METYHFVVVVPAALVDLWVWFLALALLFAAVWVLRWLGWMPGTL